ncbi:hypothetical protein UPYG_G00191010 [Umbra pygmaea]|uniref:Multicilin n=1 Tax=Umbra pygmaea TaxID=75934 RepID=A0ABD0WTG4_UMBPY
MHRGRKAFGFVCSNTDNIQDRRPLTDGKGRTRLPRCSSPVSVYVDRIPCIVEDAFATIAWDDLEDCASLIKRDSDSLGSQVNDSEEDEQDFGEYALDFIAESPATLENSLSPASLVAFQGCFIPPLTPERELSSGDQDKSYSPSDTALSQRHPENETLWRGMAQHHTRVLGHALETNSQLHLSVNKRNEEINVLQHDNVQLRELANKAKHLASILDKLMTVREPPIPHSDVTHTLTSPCKRQRLDLDDNCDDTSPPGSVEDILRDVSERCNAVLHHSTAQAPCPQDSQPERIMMFGQFSGIQTSRTTGGTVVSMEATEEGVSNNDSSFRTSIREHCTIRTQAFPHGHAFTSRTNQGGFRFRWVPSQR